MSCFISLCGGKTVEEFDAVAGKLQESQGGFNKLKDEHHALQQKHQQLQGDNDELTEKQKTAESQLSAEEAKLKAQEAATHTLKIRGTATSAIGRIKEAKVRALSGDLSQRQDAINELQGQIKVRREEMRGSRLGYFSNQLDAWCTKSCCHSCPLTPCTALTR